LRCAEVRADQQVVFAAFVQDSTAFDWISPSLKLEPQVMHAFLRHDRTILDRLPDEIFLDEAFVTALANDDKFGHQTVVQLCQRNWQVLGLLPSKFQRDKKVILTCIEKDWQAIELVAERQLCQNVWADLDFVRAAVLQNAQCMSQAEDKIWDDSEIVISAMKQDIKIIDLAEEDIQEKLWNNEEVVMEAIKQDPKAIRKAAKGMWLQKEVVLPAVTGDWTVMNFCPKSNAKGWWADRDIVLAAVAQCADALGLADKLMWEDRDLVLSAVKTSYEILTKCPGHLKSDYYQDRDMVMEAVQQDAMALKEFNEEFFSDLEVVAIAARQNIVIIDSVQPKFTKRYLEDHTIALLLVEHDVQNFERIPDILKQEKDILLAAIKQKGSLLRGADKKLRKDRHFVMAAVQQDGLALEFASIDMKQNLEIVTAAVSQNGRALDFADEDLQQDEALLELAKITQK
ncbi:unnamed protein product, partial [Polarella glacialis]